MLRVKHGTDAIEESLNAVGYGDKSLCDPADTMNMPLFTKMPSEYTLYTGGLTVFTCEVSVGYEQR